MLRTFLVKWPSRTRSVQRLYATTTRESSAALLSQTLNKNQSKSQQQRDSAGPFQLGLSPTARSNQEKLKSWSELSTSGKVMRTTARTTNLTVILFGAGLFAVLTYALTTELFSKNSPTVLYDDACERIKASPKLAKYLHGPLQFHNTAPSLMRPRHRNRQVPSQLMIDSSGREHMIMSFYVEGRQPNASSESHLADSSYMDAITEYTKDKIALLSDVTLDESVAWGKRQAVETFDHWKRIFKYVSGSTPGGASPDVFSSSASDEVSAAEVKAPPKEKESAWSFAGMFSALRVRGTSGGGESTPGESGGGTVYTDGEVHVDLVRNSEGYFVFRYLLVDIPNTHSRNAIRVFIEKAPGVRTDEPVVRWSTH